MAIGRDWVKSVVPQADWRNKGRTGWSTALIVALVALAIVQSVLPLATALASDPGEHFISDGHDLSMVSVRLVDGNDVRFDGDQATLLLVFDPDCQYTDGIAVAWSEWLSNLELGAIRVLAVSPGLPDAASAYAIRQRWPVQVGTLPAIGNTLATDMITKRAPWVFAVDHNGRVAGQGHGQMLPDIAQSLVGSNQSVAESRGGGQARAVGGAHRSRGRVRP